MLCCLPGSPSACPMLAVDWACPALLAVQPVPVHHVTVSVGQGLVSGKAFLSHCNSFCQPSGLCGNPWWGCDPDLLSRGLYQPWGTVSAGGREG